MKNRLLLNAISLGILATFAGCADVSLDSIHNRLDENEAALRDLNTQISNAEQAILQLNKDIKTFQILKGGVIVSQISGSASSGWTLKLSNGTTLTIPPQGDSGNAPVLTLDDEGYWMIDYGDGAQYVLDVNGDKYSAIGKGNPGEDGVTPMIGVDAEGFWQMSLDGGQTWVPVTDASGEKVSAIIHEVESLFDDVVIGETSIIFIMKNGTKFSVPFSNGLLCVIEGSDAVQEFSYGQSRQFAVTLEGVVSWIVAGPSEWNVKLAGTTLYVTAPVSTKASDEMFDTEKNVAIYAVSADGRSTIAKIEVSLSE